MGRILKWLEENPLGLALGAICGVLVLALLLLAVFSSLPVSTELAGDAPEDVDAGLQLPQLPETPPIDTFNVITQRPLFSENRLPFVDEGGSDIVDAPMPEEDLDAPDVILSGVIITPSLRMVTLKHKDTAKSLVAFEGQPVEADFGNWQVSEIKARTAMLRSGAGKELLLELKVHDEAIEEPALPVSRPRAGQADREAGDDEAQASEPLSRAEEIRQRIAERREELRREAEALDQANEESAQPDYKNAIQSMIGRKRREQAENE